MSAAEAHSEKPAATTHLPTPEEVVWHDLECGAYRADLPLWHELAERCGDPILDVGAGTGRVTLELARAGHTITALDLDATLLRTLAERAAELDVETVSADARSFELNRHDFALCLVPMQTIQLLGGEAERLAFMDRARAHLRPGGLIACAILGELDPFDCSDGREGPAAERAQVDGLTYLSRAIRVSETPRHVKIERERRILADRPERQRIGAGGDLPRERNLIELDRLDPATLEREGAQVGLVTHAPREIAATSEHVGSAVVIFGV